MSEIYNKKEFESLLSEVSAKAISVSQLTDTINPSIAALKNMGLLRALLRKDLGGLDASLFEVSGVIQKLAESCGSTAWCYGLFVSHGRMLSNFPEETGKMILGDDEKAIIATGLAAEEGKAKLFSNKDGYSLAGKWKYISGIDMADWVALMSELPDGSPAWVLLRPADVNIDKESWKVAGLAGTQTWNIEVQANRIDKHQVVSQQKMQENLKQSGGALRGIPMPAIVPVIGASIAVGLAHQALEQMSRRVKGFGNEVQRIEGACEFSELSMNIRACELMLEKLAADVDAASGAGEEEIGMLASRSRGEAAYIINGCFDSVSKMMRYMGTQNLDLDQRFQLCLRDLAAIQTHYYVNKSESYLDYAIQYAFHS